MHIFSRNVRSQICGAILPIFICFLATPASACGDINHFARVYFASQSDDARQAALQNLTLTRPCEAWIIAASYEAGKSGPLITRMLQDAISRNYPRGLLGHVFRTWKCLPDAEQTPEHAKVISALGSGGCPQQDHRANWHIVTVEEALIRPRPNKSAGMIGKVRRGNIVTLTGSSGGWAKIGSWGNQVGYISARHIKKYQ